MSFVVSDIARTDTRRYDDRSLLKIGCQEVWPSAPGISNSSTAPSGDIDQMFDPPAGLGRLLSKRSLSPAGAHAGLSLLLWCRRKLGLSMASVLLTS